MFKNPLVGIILTSSEPVGLERQELDKSTDSAPTRTKSHGWDLKEEWESEDGNVKTHLSRPQDHRAYG